MTRKKAYEIAISCIELKQRKYNVGHLDYLRNGDRFDFSKRDHKHWTRLEQAKEILQEEIEEVIRD
jgi:hypothetical protein